MTLYYFSNFPKPKKNYQDVLKFSVFVFVFIYIE